MRSIRVCPLNCEHDDRKYVLNAAAFSDCEGFFAIQFVKTTSSSISTILAIQLCSAIQLVGRIYSPVVWCVQLNGADLAESRDAWEAGRTRTARRRIV